MGAECCNGVQNGMNDFYELSTGAWDVENKKMTYSKKRQLMITKKESLKEKNMVDIDMKITDKLEALVTDLYWKGQRPTGEDNFIDKNFKPEENSIIYVDLKKDICKDITNEEIEQIKGLQWKRPNEIFRNFNYYLYKGIEADDIKQGMLGNCYFLSSIAAIAEFKERIECIMVEKETTKNGEYQIKLYVQGIPTIVVIDDMLPCAKNSRHTAFTHSRGSDQEIWVSLIEKAWAKLNGSFAMTIAGLPSEGLSSLTMAPTVTYIHKKYSEDQIWKILIESDKLDYIICTCTQGVNDIEKVGLVPGHAYTVISLYEIDKLKLIKIRNPWGQFEWNGDFSDKSNDWNPKLKEIVGWTDKDDGIFYMKFADFLKYYPYSFICKFEREFKYCWKRYSQTPDETMVVTKIQIKRPIKIMINLHQKSARIFSDIPNYKTNMSRIILCRYYKNRAQCYEYVSSHATSGEKLHLEFAKLEEGEYHIFTHVNWPFKGFENDYVISTYAEELVEIETVKHEEIPEDFLHMIFYSYLDKNEPKKELKDKLDLQISCKDNDLGFYVMLFRNTSKHEQHQVAFDVDLNKFVRLCTKHPQSQVNKMSADHKNYTIKFSIDPETDYLVLFELENEPWLAKLNIGKVTVNSRQGVKPDPFKGVLRKHIKSLTKQKLDIADIQVTEIENDNDFFLIFINNSDDNIKVMVATSDLINIKAQKPDVMFVAKHDIGYVKLQKIESGNPVDFNYTYNIKKLLF